MPDNDPLDARHRADIQAAIEADEKLGHDAKTWVDELPLAPPLDPKHTTAVFIAKPKKD